MTARSYNRLQVVFMQYHSSSYPLAQMVAIAVAGDGDGLLKYTIVLLIQNGWVVLEVALTRARYL